MYILLSKSEILTSECPFNKYCQLNVSLLHVCQLYSLSNKLERTQLKFSTYVTIYSIKET
jgi:hypothetical protein